MNNAFLPGELNEDVYMTQPRCFEQRDHNGKVLVCNLNKVLYGIKQAPRAWFEPFTYLLFNTVQYTVQYSTIYCSILYGSVFLLVYVDDIVVIGCNTVEIERIIS